MPRIGFLSNTVRRYSSTSGKPGFGAISGPCLPVSAGIQLLKDGGWLELDLPLDSSGVRVADPAPPASVGSAG